MKNAILLLALLSLSFISFGQEILGKRETKDWKLFSGELDKPQLKRIDDDRFVAFYRTSPDESGIMVLDKNINVLKNISLKLAKTRKIIFGFDTQSIINLVPFPTYYYRKDNNSVVLIGNLKLSKSDFVLVGLTYSLDSEDLIQVDTLRHSKSDDFIIRLSVDENYFMVDEKIKNSRDSQKGYKEHIDVFLPDCKKLYSAIIDVPGNADSYSFIGNNAEIIHSYRTEEKRKITYRFSKFDAQGNSSGTALYIPPSSDIYNYEINDFLTGASGEIYCICSKERTQMEGIAILKIEFDTKTCKKITDKLFDSPVLAKIYRNPGLSISLFKDKQPKPLKSFNNFLINSAIIDKDAIYLILDNLKLSARYRSGKQDIYTYSSEEIILIALDLNGKEKWITPVRRDASYSFDGLNLYTSGGSGIRLSAYSDNNYINLILPHAGNIFAARIDKVTGKGTKPVPLTNDEHIYTNTNCLLWLDSNQVIMLTMKGIYFAFSKKEIYLNSIKIAY